MKKKQVGILGLLLLFLFMPNVYGKNPKLTEALEIVNVQVKSYDVASNSAINIKLSLMKILTAQLI